MTHDTIAARLTQLRFETLQLSVDPCDQRSREKILTITLNRPQQLNALSPAMIAELHQLCLLLHQSLGVARDPETSTDWSIRGVILTGAGQRAFAAGADIAVMHTMTARQAHSYAEQAQQLTVLIETLPVPIIAAVNGFALGGGCELALACDYIFACEHASFGQPEVALGLIPGFGGTVRLARYLGAAAARELMFTARRIDAVEALRLGLVSQLLPDRESLHQAARESLRLVSTRSPTAVAQAKRVMRQVHTLPVDEGLSVELHAFASLFGTPEMVEGTAAFLEKRRAQFSGG